MNIKNITVIGLGFIGGSIAIDLKNKLPLSKIMGFDPDQNTRQYAKNTGFIDNIAHSLTQAIKTAELIIIAAPISAYSSIFKTIKRALKPRQIITDVASVKNEAIKIAIKELGAHLPQFVPGHPLAGSEKNGIKVARRMLFNGRKVLLTPTAITNIAAIHTVTDLWKTLGASVNIMPPDQHDKILALTSHLPHILSYAFMKTIQKAPNHQEILKNTARSFDDLTRIAASDPNLWADICLANSEHIIATIDAFTENLSALKQDIISNDREKLTSEFRQAKTLKRALYQNITGAL